MTFEGAISQIAFRLLAYDAELDLLTVQSEGGTTLTWAGCASGQQPPVVLATCG